MVRLFILLAIGLLLFRMVSDVMGWGKPKPRPMPRNKPPREPLPEDARSPHDVLGVKPGASQEEIRRAYQKQIQAYHPDRVATMADELQALAEQRTKEINRAYDALRRA